MKKLDLRKELKHLYLPSAKKVQLVDVPRLKFLMIDGKIEPGEAPGTSPGFQKDMMALYGAAYTLKFTSKLREEDPIDYPVMALEGLWGLQEVDFDIRRKDNWSYTLMIMKPDHITQTMFEGAVEQVRAKKGDSPALDRLRLEEFEEGLCVQIMHIGPYDSEPETVDKLHAFASENGYALHHNHHEIYIGNPLRAKPEKLNPVLRHPVSRSLA
jgi:hypothetical protein